MVSQNIFIFFNRNLSKEDLLDGDSFTPQTTIFLIIESLFQAALAGRAHCHNFFILMMVCWVVKALSTVLFLKLPSKAM
jgi:hypothetical protein